MLAGRQSLLGAALFVCCALLVRAGRTASPRLIGTLAFVGMLTTRPSIIGEQIGPIGAVLLLCIVLFALSPEDRDIRRLRGRQGAALGACVIFPGLLAIVSHAFSLESAAGLVVAPLFAMVGVALGRRTRAAQTFVSGVVLLAAQQSAGLIGSHLLGWDSSVYVIGERASNRAGYEYVVTHFGAITTGSGGVLRLYAERLTGPFGEPGLFAGVLVIAAAAHLSLHRRWAWKPQLCLALAILLSQSIAGMWIYVLVLIVHTAMRARARRSTPFKVRHYLVIGVAMSVALRSAAQSSGILSAKAEVNAGSTGDRLAGVSPHDLLFSWLRHPLGVRGSAVGAINLVQASISNGPLILAFGIWLFFAPLRSSKGVHVAPIVAATTAVVMFAQPPFLYTWILLTFMASGIAEASETVAEDAPAVSATVPTRRFGQQETTMR